VEHLHDYDDWFLGASDRQLVGAGHSVCQGFDQDMSYGDVQLLALAAGFPAYVVDYFIGASIGAFCPEYGDEILS
jgi:hypothetical protein